jgi:hypothetical protein
MSEEEEDIPESVEKCSNWSEEPKRKKRKIPKKKKEKT